MVDSLCVGEKVARVLGDAHIAVIISIKAGLYDDIANDDERRLIDTLLNQTKELFSASDE